MIKNRRKERPRNAASSRRNTKTTASARAIGTGKAKRDAMVNFRRGITETNKPSAMDIEREVYRQTRKTAPRQQARGGKQGPSKGNGRPEKRMADIKVKAKMTKQRNQQQKQQQQQNPRKQTHAMSPPAWVGGTRRPPSKKAVQAAVQAMGNKGFQIPKGMQMVISFAPAPEANPTKDTPKQNKKGGGNSNNNKGGNRGNANNNANNNSAKKNAGARTRSNRNRNK